MSGAPVFTGSPWMFTVVAAPAQRDPIVEVVLLFISTFRPWNYVMRFQVFGRSAFLAPISVTLLDLESPCRSTCRSFVVVSFMRKRFIISAFNTNESGLIRFLHDLDDLGVSFRMALRADQRNSNKIIAHSASPPPGRLLAFWALFSNTSHRRWRRSPRKEVFGCPTPRCPTPTITIYIVVVGVRQKVSERIKSMYLFLCPSTLT